MKVAIAARRFARRTRPIKPVADSDFDEVPISLPQIKQAAKSIKSQQLNRSTGIVEQITSQKHAKGRKEFYIDSDESLDWFIRTQADPARKRSGFLKHQETKEEMAQNGEMPASLEEHLQNVQVQAKIAPKFKEVINENEQIIATDFQLRELFERDVTDKQLHELENENLEVIKTGLRPLKQGNQTSAAKEQTEIVQSKSLTEIIKQSKQEAKRLAPEPVAEPTPAPASNDSAPAESKLSRKQKKDQNKDPNLPAPIPAANPPTPMTESKLQAQLMKQYATGDQSLNSHIFGNLVLKSVDFSQPEIKSLFTSARRPKGKKEVFDFQLEKLRIMLLFYDGQDFEEVKFYKLNSDQILQFLQVPNFVGP